MSARTVASLLFTLSACAGAHATTPVVVAAPETLMTVVSANEEKIAPTLSELTVTIRPRSGSSVSGRAVLTQTAAGVSVRVEVENASPGLHGLHVHDRADCSADDAASAGAHFNPDNQPHGLPVEDARHLGDLGNLSVSPAGSGRLVVHIPGAVLTPGEARSLLGRAIVLKSDADDGSQDAAQTGARIACGEVQMPTASN
jgi:Cu-Zn family superoxide dismutase